MKRRLLLWLTALVALGVAAPAEAVHDGDFRKRMSLVFESPNATDAINSDLAFWGDRAYAGNYDGFRIFDISDPAHPRLVTDHPCFGPQNDLSVWDRNGDGRPDPLITSVDRTLELPACGAPAVAHDALRGWEGLRLFDISDERTPVQIDESFGSGCPTKTKLATGETVKSGNMFFMRTSDGTKLSEFRMPRTDPQDDVAQYCSAHLGNVVPMPGRNLLVNAWYTAGVDVIDFTSPKHPKEIAYFDRDGDNWSAYWYENSRISHPGGPLRIYASDGVEDQTTGDGFQALTANIRGRRVGFSHLNPQTQERVVTSAGH